MFIAGLPDDWPPVSITPINNSVDHFGPAAGAGAGTGFGTFPLSAGTSPTMPVVGAPDIAPVVPGLPAVAATPVLVAALPVALGDMSVPVVPDAPEEVVADPLVAAALSFIALSRIALSFLARSAAGVFALFEFVLLLTPVSVPAAGMLPVLGVTTAAPRSAAPGAIDELPVADCANVVDEIASRLARSTLLLIGLMSFPCICRHGCRLCHRTCKVSRTRTAVCRQAA